MAKVKVHVFLKPGVLDGLALHVQHAGLEEDLNLDLGHQCNPP